MGLLAGLIGSSSGMMIVCYTRALRKVPLFSSAAPEPNAVKLGAGPRAARCLPEPASLISSRPPQPCAQSRGST